MVSDRSAVRGRSAVRSGGLDIVAAEAADAGEIWTVQRAAYLDEAQAYGDPYIAALTETQEQVAGHMAAGFPLLKAVSGTRIVGIVRGRSTGPTFLVNRLAVVPDQRRKGIARALLTAMERHVVELFPDVRALALFAGQAVGDDLRLYRSLGYVETSRERIADHLTMVHLRRQLPDPAAPV
ncbi:GNAT family N-acetyltransferase [Nocardiopsis mangrovi]|uniref:GNAT family N-acetyltransferase n=1 Tax=Nocardiopsis mangrovi TaxID=1179818 RepID=A0ABV9DSJ7_9ACTN